MSLANSGTEQLETEAGRQTPERVEELVKIFIKGTKVSDTPLSSSSLRHLTVRMSQLEIGFWEMFPSE